MKTWIKFFLILIILFLGCKDHPCTDCFWRITVQNNSNSYIAFLVSYNYPDTIIPNQFNSLKGIKGMDYSFYDSKQKWEDEFAKTKSGKMSFFFFSPDTITKYSWDSVRISYKILERKEVTLQNVQNNQWVITYP